MKTKKQIITAAFLTASCLLTACQGVEGDSPQPAPTRPVPLQLSSGITTTVTRAFDASWEASDKIGVFTVKAGSTNASDITRSGTYEDANIPYVLSGTAGSTASGSAGSYTYTYQGFTAADNIDESEEKKQIYLPLDGSNVDVYAYYPYDNTASASGKTITLETTQTAEGQKTYDLMSAKADKCSDGTNPINIDHIGAQLLFQHELSKVLIKIKVGTGYTEADLADVALQLQGQATSATFNPLTRALDIDAATATGTIVPYKLESGDVDYSKLGNAIYIYRALVMPTTSASGSIVITVGSGTTATFAYNIPQALSAGIETVFTLTLQATGITVTAAITPWSESSSVPETPIYETSN